MRKARELGAHEYRVKPSAVEDLTVMLRDLHGRWMAEPRQDSPEYESAP